MIILLHANMHLLVPVIFLLLVLLLFNLIYSLFWVPLRVQLHFKKQGIRGPKQHPIYGNSEEMKRMFSEAESRPTLFNHDIVHRVSPHYHKWSAMYGKTFVFWMGNKPRLAIAEPDLIKELMLSHTDSVEKIPISTTVKPLLGDGLLSAQGKKWAVHRRICSKAFTLEKVKVIPFPLLTYAWVPVIAANSMELLKKWEKERQGRIEFELDVHKEFDKLASENISRTAFGSSFEEAKPIFELQERLVATTLEALRSIHIPGIRFLPTRKNRMIWKLERGINDSMKMLIKKNKYKRDSNSNNFLNMLMAANDNYGLEDDALEIQEVIDECKTFHLAGKETTVSLLTWVLILLSKHQEWQSKARGEVFLVCGDAPPNAKNLNGLKIVTMILNETMRLYPPVPLVVRRTTKNIKLGNLDIPTNTQFHIALVAVHHDRGIWGEDANEFNPERFDGRGKHMASYFPFGLGPRFCVAQNLAIYEAKVVLAMVLKQYSFAISPSYVHAPRSSFSIEPQYGAQILFRPVSA